MRRPLLPSANQFAIDSFWRTGTAYKNATLMRGTDQFVRVTQNQQGSEPRVIFGDRRLCQCSFSSIPQTPRATRISSLTRCATFANTVFAG
jgi:hypothetical protein